MAMEVGIASAIKTEPPSEDNGESPSEESNRSSSPIHYELDKVLLVMPKIEPSYPEAEESIEGDYPECDDIKKEICIDEINSKESDKDTDSEACNNTIPDGSRQFKCPVCAKEFWRKYHLQRHMSLHEEKGKRFECPHCDKKFSRTDHLKTHIIVHTGERGHACPTCGKMFTRSWVLTNHQLVHTKEKRFQCPHCSKKFGRVDHYNVHLMKQHAVNNILCKESESKTS